MYTGVCVSSLGIIGAWKVCWCCLIQNGSQKKGGLSVGRKRKLIGDDMVGCSDFVIIIVDMFTGFNTVLLSVTSNFVVKDNMHYS